MADPQRIVEAPAGSVGQLALMGQSVQIMDLGAEGIPPEGCDILFMPKGGMAPFARAECPRGAMLLFLEPAAAAQLRGMIQRTRPAPAKPS